MYNLIHTSGSKYPSLLHFIKHLWKTAKSGEGCGHSGVNESGCPSSGHNIAQRLTRTRWASCAQEWNVDWVSSTKLLRKQKKNKVWEIIYCNTDNWSGTDTRTNRIVSACRQSRRIQHTWVIFWSSVHSSSQIFWFFRQKSDTNPVM